MGSISSRCADEEFVYLTDRIRINMEPTAENDGFNADELVAPDWLNAQFLQEVLSSHEKSPELKVLDVKMSPASGKGDHYASVMFRANVTYTTQKGNYSKSLIIKTMPELEGHKKEMLGDSHIFETEIGMYTKVLPKFEEILRKVGDNTRLYADCIYQSLEPREVMIFEDLVPQGYIVLRDREATVEELKAAYSKLAKWHAASFHILHENPDSLNDFKYGLFDMPKLLEDPFMSTGMRLFLDFLDTVPELSKFKPYLQKMEKDYMLHLRDIMLEYRNNRQPDGYYVLSHGDFHLRNLMFKHNKISGNLEDVMLVDFQISNLCPITIDLIYSTYILMGLEHRRNNHKEIIDFYFTEFVNTLQKIGFKGELPNLVGFWKQIHRHKYYDIFLLTTLLPMLYALKENTFETSEILQHEEIRAELYYSKVYVENVKHLLPKFQELGYFD